MRSKRSRASGTPHGFVFLFFCSGVLPNSVSSIVQKCMGGFSSKKLMITSECSSSSGVIVVV